MTIALWAFDLCLLFGLPVVNNAFRAVSVTAHPSDLIVPELPQAYTTIILMLTALKKFSTPFWLVVIVVVLLSVERASSTEKDGP